MSKLILVRGVSGSGKSTYVYNKLGDMTHLEADHYFMDDATGEYKFDGSLIKKAHDWCYGNTRYYVGTGNDVVVSNTFTQLWEMQRYLDMKKSFPDLEIEVVEMLTQYQNVHGVPEDKVQQMKDRWEVIDWESMGIPCTKIQ